MEKNIISNNIADVLITMNENLGFCDKDTALGFKTSKKKEIFKSKREGSFSRFQQEIMKVQNRKN